MRELRGKMDVSTGDMIAERAKGWGGGGGGHAKTREVPAVSMFLVLKSSFYFPWCANAFESPPLVTATRAMLAPHLKTTPSLKNSS